ncbi:MAG: XRE family transcriptional regulator [Proteobacteria bacterium]|nr:XRE family transcriptional regulator [Pseudomonadota bacterium]
MNKTTNKKPARPKRATPKAAPDAAKSVPERHMPNLGDCLRAIRFKRRLTLADVSVATGIARSTLSRVESNQLSLTYDKLIQLSRGLQIDLTELLSSRIDGEAPPTLTRRTVTAPASGKIMEVGTSVYRYMCTEMSAKRMTPMWVEIHAHSLAETNGLLAHQGEEFTFVLAGTVRLHTEFYEPTVLETGAAVYFDSTMRHTYVAVGDRPAQILCVCAIADANVHELTPVLALAPAVTKARISRGRPRATKN